MNDYYSICRGLVLTTNTHDVLRTSMYSTDRKELLLFINVTENVVAIINLPTENETTLF